MVSHISALLGLLFIVLLPFSYSDAQLPPKIDQTDWKQLGEELAELLPTNHKDLDYHFDQAAFWKRIVVPKPIDPNIQRLNKDILEEGSALSFRKLLDITPNTYAFKYLYSRADSVLVLRQWDEEEGFNYLWFKIDHIGNRWKVVDLYSVKLGQYVSQQIKNTLYMPRVLRLLGDERSRRFLANADIYVEASGLLREAAYEQAYLKVSGIPVKERLIEHQQFKVNVAIMLGAKEKLQRSVAEHRAHFPNDKSLSIILIDYYLTQAQYDEVLQALSAVQALVEQDPYLFYQKSLVYEMAAQHQLALAAIQNAIAAEPDLEVYYFQWFDLYAQKRQHKAAVEVLEQLRQRYGYTIDQLQQWAAFYRPRVVRSGAFKRWKRQQEKNTASSPTGEEAVPVQP